MLNWGLDGIVRTEDGKRSLREVRLFYIDKRQGTNGKLVQLYREPLR